MFNFITKLRNTNEKRQTDCFAHLLSKHSEDWQKFKASLGYKVSPKKKQAILSYSLKGSDTFLYQSKYQTVANVLCMFCLIRCPQGLGPVLGVRDSSRSFLQCTKQGSAQVSSLVFCEVGFPTEALSTFLTFKRPLSCVNSLMLNEAHFHIKSISTFTTFIRLLTSVSPLVLTKGFLHAKDLPTVTTFIGFLS